MTDPVFLRFSISVLAFVAMYLLAKHGYGPIMRWLKRQEQSYDRVLRQQLLMEVSPRLALTTALTGVVALGIVGALLTASPIGGLILAVIAFFVPHMLIRHMEEKRRQRLDQQLVDALTTLASAARAGLNLVQAMELLTKNHTGPVRQEFAQILREYQMGLDLNQAMHNASDRIGSGMYRLTFTAVEIHRRRGGDLADSLDRIADSIRDIQRLEGKLDALTAQGRSQAMMMAVMPVVFLGILYVINPEGTMLLFATATGRLILLGVALAIILAFIWIRRIMAIDI
jgi:tight adherence protein B